MRVLILGAAGRDFHNFNVYFRANPRYNVVAFTAAQIPNIADRLYPPELAGPRYPHGIPIFAEANLEQLLHELRIDQAVFAYSDVAHVEVMHRASQVLAAGADFVLLGPNHTQLRSLKPVIAVCAVRTGAGKSPTARHVAHCLRQWGQRVVTLRHPMPYGDLRRQAVQRFGRYEDLAEHECTIEEREEYEPILEEGGVVYSGIDYERVLRLAEAEADVILWDGGNNDLPFLVPDLHVVLADPHRAGHELTYHPGEANVRTADICIINKVDTAPPGTVERVRHNLAALNPRATIVEAESPLEVASPEAVKGCRVLAVEDGPTLTHGEMPYGAAYLAAQHWGAAVVDPRPYARGSLAESYRQFPQLGPVLPALGYGSDMIKDLAATINAVPADLVLCGTPIDLGRLILINKPMQRVRYGYADHGVPRLADLLSEWWNKRQA